MNDLLRVVPARRVRLRAMGFSKLRDVLPDTAAVGSIAKLSVSEMPARGVASSSSKSVCFSV